MKRYNELCTLWNLYNSLYTGVTEFILHACGWLSQFSSSTERDRSLESCSDRSVIGQDGVHGGGEVVHVSIGSHARVLLVARPAGHRTFTADAVQISQHSYSAGQNVKKNHGPLHPSALQSAHSGGKPFEGDRDELFRVGRRAHVHFLRMSCSTFLDWLTEKDSALTL